MKTCDVNKLCDRGIYSSCGKTAVFWILFPNIHTIHSYCEGHKHKYDKSLANIKLISHPLFSRFVTYEEALSLETILGIIKE